MQGPYTLQDSRVLCEGREELRRIELNTAVLAALRRKLRRTGHDRTFFRQLKAYGEASLTWNFTHKVRSQDDHWVTFHAWSLEQSAYSLYCIGPQADNVIERINDSLQPKRSKRDKKLATEAKRIRNKSRKRKKKKKKNRVTEPQLPKPKKGRKAVASHQHELLMPQFRKSRIFWSEAVEMAVSIFNVRGDWKRSARQIVADKLYRSLDKTDGQFAQFRQEGFCLQFTIPDGRWRGIGLTPVTVSCTKDNRNPVYRRMRKWMRRTLHGLPPRKQAVRRDLLWQSEIRIAA